MNIDAFIGFAPLPAQGKTSRKLQLETVQFSGRRAQRSEERVPTNMLSTRLKRLVELGLVEKAPYQDRPVRYRYALTEAGQGLEPVLLSLMAWGHGNLGGGRYDPATKESTPPG